MSPWEPLSNLVSWGNETQIMYDGGSLRQRASERASERERERERETKKQIPYHRLAKLTSITYNPRKTNPTAIHMQGIEERERERERDRERKNDKEGKKERKDVAFKSRE